MLKSVVCSIVLFFLSMVKAGDFTWEAVSKRTICNSRFVVTVKVKCCSTLGVATSILDVWKILEEDKKFPPGEVIKVEIRSNHGNGAVCELTITNEENCQKFERDLLLEGLGIEKVVVKVGELCEKYGIYICPELMIGHVLMREMIATEDDFKGAAEERRKS